MSTVFNKTGFFLYWQRIGLLSPKQIDVCATYVERSFVLLNALQTFWIGFNECAISVKPPSGLIFDFRYDTLTYLIDCGASDQAADVKLQDAFMLIGAMPSCKMAMLAVANDAGYTQSLGEVCQKGGREKVHLIGMATVSLSN